MSLRKEILIYGLSAGALVTILDLTEYRFLVVERSVEIYGALIAVLFAGLGIWIGLELKRGGARELSETGQPALATGFTCDPDRLATLGITPRELETLSLMATGLSNREIANRLFISENTVKTHSKRLFDKLGARRRTDAVRIGKESRLIP